MRVWRNKETIQWQKKCTSPLSLEKISSPIQKRCASIKHRAYQNRFSKPMTDECASRVDFGLVNLEGSFNVFFGMPLRPFMPAMIALVFVLEFLNVKGDYYALFEGVDISGWRYWAR